MMERPASPPKGLLQRVRRLRPADRLQLLLLVPLWALCFGLETRSVLRDTAIAPLFVARADSPGDPYLRVTGLVPWLATEGEGPTAGDRILAVGDTDLRGADRIGFRVAVAHEVEPGRRVRVAYERGGVRHDASLRVGSSRSGWPNLLVSLAWALVAVVVLLRVPEQPMARVVFQGYLCAGFLYANGIGGTRVEEWIGMPAVLASATLLDALLLRAALVFPHNDPPRSRWLRSLPWCFTPIGPLHFSRVYGFPLPPELGAPLIGALFVLFAVSVALAARRSYRRADALGRRQMKWLVYGVYLSLLIYTAGSLLVAFDPVYAPIFAASEAGTIFTPLGFLVSIVGFRFLDIDRLLSATASYNVVVVALLGLGLAVVPTAAEHGAALAGVDPIVGRNLLCLGLAALVVPAQRRLRPGVDRLFFAERHALQEQSALLLQDLAKSRNPEELARTFGERIDALVRPEACVVYAGAGGAFAPVFVAGRAVPPAFEAESALVATLRARRKPLALRDKGRARDRAELGPFDRAALEALQAEVVVPVRRDEALLAFLCLGPKRSGDVYTATDLSLLAAVAAAASAQLHGFDQAEVIAAGRTMQEALRRYVPGVVAEQIASGAEPAEGEREVSVLFVDIRGYTSFSEGHRSEEIFSTVNRYTEAVSEAVRAQGGAVVEFNGDGMMAVFGAPIELAHKERVAVAAGRAILDAVATLPVEEGGNEPDRRLSVGVGIATGIAFVGSLRAVDRLIWTALGTTTNLAARLQALTRELDVPLVVDHATWEKLGTGAADFELHPAVSLRGLRHAADVYALAGAHPAARTRRAAGGLFRKEGDVWRIAYSGREVRLRDQRGLAYLAELLRHPGKEIHSLDLVRAGSGGGVPLASAAAAAAAAAREAEGALSVARGLGDAGEAIDARARAAYRARLAELDEDLAEAERHHDLGRLESLQEEREALLAELAGAARGSGGAAASDAERARVAVTKGLKAATDRIAASHPELAAHLAATLRRGTFCCYQPDPAHPVEWDA
jgi:class 3 adenylate cyclase